MRSVRSLKFKSTVSCMLTILTLCTFVACGNDDHHADNNPAEPGSPTAEELARQEAARQQVLAVQQEAARQEAILEGLRAPKYLTLTFINYRPEGDAGLEFPSSSPDGLFFTGGDGTRDNPGLTPVGCIKLAIQNAGDLTDVELLQYLVEISTEYHPYTFWGENSANSERELNAVLTPIADIDPVYYGNCGIGEAAAVGYSCVIQSLEPGMDDLVNDNWWRTHPRLIASLYFNEAFNNDQVAAAYVCELISGQLFHAGQLVVSEEDDASVEEDGSGTEEDEQDEEA